MCAWSRGLRRGQSRNGGTTGSPHGRGMLQAVHPRAAANPCGRIAIMPVKVYIPLTRGMKTGDAVATHGASRTLVRVSALLTGTENVDLCRPMSIIRRGTSPCRLALSTGLEETRRTDRPRPAGLAWRRDLPPRPCRGAARRSHQQGRASERLDRGACAPGRPRPGRRADKAEGPAGEAPRRCPDERAPQERLARMDRPGTDRPVTAAPRDGACAPLRAVPSSRPMVPGGPSAPGE
jgi:hypothetical protein